MQTGETTPTNSTSFLVQLKHKTYPRFARLVNDVTLYFLGERQLGERYNLR